MRIWDLEPKLLCNKHLVAEHFEAHCIYNIITGNKPSNYKNHPEIKRWVGKVDALCVRHEMVVAEMIARNLNHKSPMKTVGDNLIQDIKLITTIEQFFLLEKRCVKCKEKLHNGFMVSLEELFKYTE